MCPIKEPHFFAYEGGVPDFKGPNANQHQFWQTRPVDIEEYKELFNGATTQKVIGEASTYYICEPRAAANIKSRVPDAKLVALLRNPTERAYSNFLHCRKNGLEPEHDFRRALDLEQQRTLDGWGMIWRYREKGNYFEQLQRYLELFNEEQILICLTDDLMNQPHTLMRRILRFLDVDPNDLPDMSKRRNQAASSLMQQHPLDESTRKQLIADYRDGILKLQELLQRDLSMWLS